MRTGSWPALPLAVFLTLVAASCGDESLDELKERRRGESSKHPETEEYMVLYRAAQKAPSRETFVPLLPYLARADLTITYTDDIVSQTAEDLTEIVFHENLAIAFPVVMDHLRELHEQMPDDGPPTEELAALLQHPLRFAVDLVVGKGFVSGKVPDVTLVLPFASADGEGGSLEIGYYYRAPGQVPGTVVRLERAKLGEILAFIDERVSASLAEAAEERAGTDL